MKTPFSFILFTSIPIIILFVIIPSCAPRQPNAASLGIYIVDNGGLFLSDQDMSAYIQASHKIVLNKSGITKWNSYIAYNNSYDPPIPVLGELYQKNFAIKIDNNEIYGGKFWSSVSSLSYDGVVILDMLFPCDSIKDTITIAYGYPTSSYATANDPRNNPEIFNFLSQKGLLK